MELHARIMVSLVILASACLAFPLAAQSPPVEGCGTILMNNCSNQQHVFIEDQEDGTHEAHPEGYHGECLSCRKCDEFGCWTVSPAECHLEGCSSGEEEQTAFQEVMEAASRGDVSALVFAAAEVPHRVQIHPTRRTIQIVSCDRQTVIANLPLGAAYVSAAFQFRTVSGSVGTP